VEAGSAFEGLTIAGERGASLRNDELERFEVGDMLVDDGLVDGLPEVLCGLEFGGVG